MAQLMRISKPKNELAWNRCKDDIHRIYMKEHHTLAETMHLILEKYGSQAPHAKERTWKAKLKLWNFDKYTPERHMRIVVAKSEQRSRDGKETDFFYNGNQISKGKIENFKKRDSTTEEAIAIPPAAEADTPTAITYHTPPPGVADHLPPVETEQDVDFNWLHNLYPFLSRSSSVPMVPHFKSSGNRTSQGIINATHEETSQDVSLEELEFTLPKTLLSMSEMDYLDQNPDGHFNPHSVPAKESATIPRHPIGRSKSMNIETQLLPRGFKTIRATEPRAIEIEYQAGLLRASTARENVTEPNTRSIHADESESEPSLEEKEFTPQHEQISGIEDVRFYQILDPFWVMDVETSQRVRLILGMDVLVMKKGLNLHYVSMSYVLDDLNEGVEPRWLAKITTEDAGLLIMRYADDVGESCEGEAEINPVEYFGLMN